MVAATTWKRLGLQALVGAALLGCGSEPLESGDDPPSVGSTETASAVPEVLPTRAEQLDAVVGYCTRLSTFCPDFSVGLCTDVQVSLLPEEGHRCHAAVVHRTMCLASLAREQLECTSQFSAEPTPPNCDAERASASACYEHP